MSERELKRQKQEQTKPVKFPKNYEKLELNLYPVPKDQKNVVWYPREYNFLEKCEYYWKNEKYHEYKYKMILDNHEFYVKIIVKNDDIMAFSQCDYCYNNRIVDNDLDIMWFDEADYTGYYTKKKNYRFFDESFDYVEYVISVKEISRS